ncbi:MAG TPA: TIGR02217 family protein, partial [Devosia sp.]
ALDHAATDQAIGTGDGLAVGFQLTKRYGASFDPYLRPITKPVAETVVVKVDGVVVPATADPLTGIVTLAEPPAGGAAVTASFEFDVPVRFDVDRLDIELSSFDAAEAPNIPLIEVRE